MSEYVYLAVESESPSVLSTVLELSSETVNLISQWTSGTSENTKHTYMSNRMLFLCIYPKKILNV